MKMHFEPSEFIFLDIVLIFLTKLLFNSNELLLSLQRGKFMLLILLTVTKATLIVVHFSPFLFTLKFEKNFPL